MLLLVVTAGAGGAFLYYRSVDSGLRRTDAFRGAHNPRAVKATGGAQNILLLGSDSRAADDPNHKPEPGDAHTDTIVVMHVDAAREKAYLISIPRDLYVYVPRSPAHPEFGDTTTKINAAFAWGGVPLAVQAIEGYTGVRIDHVVMVDFEGFKKVADVLGGVDVNNGREFTSIAEPYYRTFQKGTIHLDGAAALDYVRQRQQFADGDFTRMCHQQQFLKALLDRATSTGTLSNPRKLDAFLKSVTKTLTVDNGFSLASAALQFRNIGSTDLTFLVSPNLGPQMIGDQSVMAPDDAKAKTLYAAVVKDRVAGWISQNGTGAEEVESGACAGQ
ncbi:MAG: cell envelope-related transcriptional attenuator [Dactylosporangium sp.]|nr:cell envelope-related transcriptional attenuator [Dactylosporangium sp.]